MSNSYSYFVFVFPQWEIIYLLFNHLYFQRVKASFTVLFEQHNKLYFLISRVFLPLPFSQEFCSLYLYLTKLTKTIKSKSCPFQALICRETYNAQGINMYRYFLTKIKECINETHLTNKKLVAHRLLNNLPKSCLYCLVVQSCPTLTTPWTEACQSSLMFPVSQSLLKLMSIEMVMPSNHLILCPSPSPPVLKIRVFFQVDKSIGVSASAPVLPMTVQDWFPLGQTDLNSCSLRDFQESPQTPQLESINSLALSLLYGPALNICTWFLEKP